MNPSNLLDNKTVRFYSNPLLHTPTKKLITEDYSQVFLEGRKAWFNGLGSNENPYDKNDGTAIWSKYDVWQEGYLSGSSY